MARCLRKIWHLDRLLLRCLQIFTILIIEDSFILPQRISTWDLFSVVGQCGDGEAQVWRGRRDDTVTGDTPINIQIQDAQIICKNVQIGWETDTGHHNSASILHNLGVIKFLRFYKPEQLHQWHCVGRSAGAISTVANTEVTTYFGWHTSLSLNR